MAAGGSSGPPGDVDILALGLGFTDLMTYMETGEVPVRHTDLAACRSLGVTHPSELYQFKALQYEGVEKDSWSWDCLKSFLEGLVDKNKHADLDTLLKKLVSTSQEILGKEVNYEELKAGAVYLCKVLRGTKYISIEQTSQLKLYFGSFHESCANRALNIIKQIEELTDLEIINWTELDLPPKDSDLMDKPFGHNIQINFSMGPGKMFDGLSDSEDEEEEQSGFFDFDWLLDEIRAQFQVKELANLGMSVNDIGNSVFEMLTTQRSNDEIQQDLFELLGFDRISLIEDVLRHREQLVNNPRKNQPRSRPSIDPAALRSLLPKANPTPAYGCQVVVQSEEEKQLRKMMQKEEKRFKKQGGVLPGGDMQMEIKQAALVAAQNKPIFVAPSQPVERYPFVFDAKVEIRSKSAIISGTKLMLPESTEYLKDDIKEEVRLPPRDPPPTNMGDERIQVTKLPHMIQKVFHGFKELNLIQSVVFNAAFSTSENLLISAPTGAGKTNIALLTVCHEIMQNLKGDTVEKDFKVIYVAPMKALAAEMTESFGKRLAPLGLAVKELTGDMQLSKAEISRTQMLVTTPEKWDVVTRKSTGDISLVQAVKLLIIDEVHLLHEDRGAVIESLVARTLRQVESTQSRIRLVALSATLPNYLDVARFLHVNPYKGLFYFDSRFRPVPLSQTFVGLKATNIMKQLIDLDDVCYQKVKDVIRRGYQCMVFVHSRTGTVKTAQALKERAITANETELFLAETWTKKYHDAKRDVGRSRNNELKELFGHGFSIHHAGMLRSDRSLVEKCFSQGHLKVLVCTATLAWGVNLPAHAVVIKGTQYYDAQKGAFVDIGILDVLQIFGRAGRPQFDTFGEGTIITTVQKLNHYLGLMTRQTPIESQYVDHLTDNLNAEIVLGTVTNIEEAVRWLRYTYMYIRMKANPIAYGIGYDELGADPDLEIFLTDLVKHEAQKLDNAKMIRYESGTGYLFPTDMGRTASHYYIKFHTIELINEGLKHVMSDGEILRLVSSAEEFQQLKVRDEEIDELKQLQDNCWFEPFGGVENNCGKVNILLQSYISREFVESFSLISDLMYISQNSSRITRALFDIALKRGWPMVAQRLLVLCKCMEQRMWEDDHPLQQCTGMIQTEYLQKLTARNLTVEMILEMPSSEIGALMRKPAAGKHIKEVAKKLARISVQHTIQPITRSVLRVRLVLSAKFKWDDKLSGSSSEPFWLWVEDPDNNYIYHSEYVLLTKKQAIKGEDVEIVFTIPIFEPLPPQYMVHVESDRWLGCESTTPMSFKHLLLPEQHPPHTELQDLDPLPLRALKNPEFEKLFTFTHFNPIQTQIFHTLYHTDCNVLLGAPTGSGKTIAAEICMFKVFRDHPGMKVVYIAPLKALVRERVKDWKVRLEQRLGKSVVELTGDVVPDGRAISSSDVIVTTPEKWDGVSRSWQTRQFVRSVALIVIDEIHLLGDDRGPVLEVIVSRTNFISAHTDMKVRVVGLSTALANARDLADWLGIKSQGLFNFRPSVRPVPLEIHISGFAGRHYCPRMATMNKPAFQAIKTHSPTKPVLIFVSSRRQTRLTALDLVAFLVAEDNPKQWLHVSEAALEQTLSRVKENNLKLLLAFGIGIHHAGLTESDRNIVEEMFVSQKIQVLIATATLAWGVNFPAHLVIVKGTEFYDGKSKKYQLMPITDVLQMIGRAGRPQFDNSGKACVFVHDVQKHFYKKFLYEPFPVESSLLGVLSDHLNAEIIAGTVSSKQDAIEYVTWTYFFRRLLINPSFYGLEEMEPERLNSFLSSLVETSVRDLSDSYCVAVGEDSMQLEPQILGRIASYYYVSHLTVRLFQTRAHQDASHSEILKLLTDVTEYNELPVRHNEDTLNADLAKLLPIEVNEFTYDDPHTKAHLLLQAHFTGTTLPCTDYLTDTKSVLDQSIRILQALLDCVADNGWLAFSLRIMQLIQMIVQGLWLTQSPFHQLPHFDNYLIAYLAKQQRQLPEDSPVQSVQHLPELMYVHHGNPGWLPSVLDGRLRPHECEKAVKALETLPLLKVNIDISGFWAAHGAERQRIPLKRLHPSESALRRSDIWQDVHADQEYLIEVLINRLNHCPRNAHAPKFPKPKPAGWFLVLGDVENQELLALKRMTSLKGSQSAVSLSFFTPEQTGRVIYTLYLMSDSYLGLDQQYDIYLNVIPANIEAQLQTELSDIASSSSGDEDGE